MIFVIKYEIHIMNEGKKKRVREKRKTNSEVSV